MPSFMMSSRRIDDGEPGDALNDTMNYYVSSETTAARLTRFAAWTPIGANDFRDQLTAIAAAFPSLPDAANEGQKHLSLFIHGYNVDWKDAVTRYADLQKRLYAGPGGLGQLLLYSWPSNGSVAGYLPDREDVRKSAPLLADALVTLHDHVIAMQRLAARDPSRQCRAKISVIAHSMGNYVMQKALASAARTLNSPQLVTLIHQLVMVAADVDNDLLQASEVHGSDGSLMANLCYRIAALYTGLDQVLGASAGLKHFGTRRLGRSGLADRDKVWDNVIDIDVTNYIDQKKSIHSAALESPKSIELMREILRGVDRHFLP